MFRSFYSYCLLLQIGYQKKGTNKVHIILSRLIMDRLYFRENIYKYHIISIYLK